MRFKGPLATSYPAAVALVVFALIPYLGLAAALTPLSPLISKGLHLSKQSLELTDGMSNAAYAVGTVLAVQFAVHLPQRRMLLLYVTLFLISSVLAAWAPLPGLYIAGHIVQGLTTSLMLIAAVPPLVIGWPTARMRWTAIIMNLCIFGAVAVGPVIGGVQAGAGHWRPLFWIVSGIAALAVVFALLTFQDDPPADRRAPWDLVAMGLAAGGCSAAFFGASELASHSLIEPLTLAPLVGGVLMIVALVVHESTTERPLMPVRQFFTTIPVVGVIIALTAGAASFSLIALIQTALMKTTSPTHIAMLFWPQFGGAVLSAVLFGVVFRSRLVAVFAFAGMALVAGAAAVLSGVSDGSQVLVIVGSGLLGLGVGASVSPALFIAGFSLANTQLQRVFALIELLRGTAAFMVAPLVLHLAMTTGKTPAAGEQTAIWVSLGIAAGGGLLAICIWILGRARLQKPDLERWMAGEGPAWDSPPLAAGIRRRAGRKTAADQQRLTPALTRAAPARRSQPRAGRAPATVRDKARPSG